jgi:hypothetical protein
MSDTHSRYRSILRHLAAALSDWRSEEELEIHEMADRIGIDANRVRSALLAEDWRPRIDDLAKMEVAMDADVFIVFRDKDETEQ